MSSLEYRGFARSSGQLRTVKRKGLVVIGDIKRGDIGSTSAAYAAAHLGKVQVGSSLCAGFDEDFVTVNPYLGSDGVQPFIDVCREEQKGIFVLVKTSNPSSGEFQGNRMVSTGGITFSEQALYELVGMKVEEWGGQLMGTKELQQCGRCGWRDVSRAGKGAAQSHAARVYPCAGVWRTGRIWKRPDTLFDENRLGAIVNSSRGIIAAYQNEKYSAYGAENFADASRQAVLDMIADIDQAFASADR